MIEPAELEPIKAATVGSSLDAIVVVDEEGLVLGFNPAAERLFGYAEADALGNPVADLIVPPHLRASHLAGFSARIGGRPARLLGKRVEVNAMRKDGSVIPIELSLVEVRIGEHRVFSANMRDRSEEARRDEEFEKTRRQLELAIEGAKIGAWTLDIDTWQVWYSARSREILGVAPDAPLDLRALKSIVHPDDWPRVAAPYYQGFPENDVATEYRVRRPDGSWRWVYALGTAVRDEAGAFRAVHGIHIDITDRKCAEEDLARSRRALIQSEKLAALGALLAGVSHELNNPLAAIVGQAEMLVEDSVGTPFESRAKRIGAAAERCARIVQTFLAMARQRDQQKMIVSINDIVGSALELADYGLRTSGIAVRVNFGSQLPAVDADSDQLHQVLINLVVNAQQAMERGEAFEKILTIRTSSTPAGQVRIDVSDTGPGVPETMTERIFEPFFTTKGHGRGGGTGIGLSFSQGVIAAHGGTLTLQPSRRGAHFRIELPGVAGDAITIVPTQDVVIPEMTPIRRRCLVVEDEPDVAETLRELIEREGYEVTLAGNGIDALLAIDRGEYDLMLSDLRMPMLNGAQLFERLSETRPDMVTRIAFITGDTIGDSMGDFARACSRPILEKPFTRAGIRAILAALSVPAE